MSSAAESEAVRAAAVSTRIGELKRLLLDEAKRKSIHSPVTCMPRNDYDEVLENCYLSNGEAARNKSLLQKLGVTHVLNAAKGEKFSQINTSQAFYNDIGVKFLGISLMDVDNCKIELHFHEATRFIDEALSTQGGKVLVHCYQGISRSATFVLAYMIKFKKMRLEDAMRMLFDKRLIWPNNGFLEKLIRYEEQYL